MTNRHYNLNQSIANPLAWSRAAFEGEYHCGSIEMRGTLSEAIARSAAEGRPIRKVRLQCGTWLAVGA